jgi:hypothetical protein
VVRIESIFGVGKGHWVGYTIAVLGALMGNDMVCSWDKGACLNGHRKLAETHHDGIRNIHGLNYTCISPMSSHFPFDSRTKIAGVVPNSISNPPTTHSLPRHSLPSNGRR